METLFRLPSDENSRKSDYSVVAAPPRVPHSCHPTCHSKYHHYHHICIINIITHPPGGTMLHRWEWSSPSPLGNLVASCLRMSHLSHFSTHSLIYPDLKSTPWYIAIKKSQICLKFLSRHPLPDIFIFPLSSNSVKSPKFTNSYFQGAAFITWQEHFPKSGCQITKSNWITMSVSKIDVGVKIFAFRHPIKW